MATLKFSEQRRSLLSSQARVQAPWVKVTIGTFTFGVFSKAEANSKNSQGFYTAGAYSIQYPNYIQSLTITKINGQVNQYTLNITYPVKQTDDPNFFEKVFSSVSKTREIIFSYGDATMPSYIYKDEKAIITSIQQSFNLQSSSISYVVNAVSGAALGTSSCFTFMATTKKPSDEIKRIIMAKQYGLRDLFTGITDNNINTLIAGDDQVVSLASKTNISALDYINYLVSCMIPIGSSKDNRSKDIYVLTLHDDTSYDRIYADRETIEGREIVGPYCKVTKMSYTTKQSDAFELDIGYNTSTIVTNFQISQNENYALYYDYNKKLLPEEYVRRINDNGKWEDVFAPTSTSRNSTHATWPDDITWWTKITKYPISATVTIQGLLRPATLMTYLRLNVIFPGGHRHISSGLYLITKQVDTIDGNGYRTQLSLTKLSGDESDLGV